MTVSHCAVRLTGGRVGDFEGSPSLGISALPEGRNSLEAVPPRLCFTNRGGTPRTEIYVPKTHAENQPKTSRKPAENQPKTSRKPQPKFSRKPQPKTSAENVSRKPAENQPKTGRKPATTVISTTRAPSAFCGPTLSVFFNSLREPPANSRGPGFSGRTSPGQLSGNYLGESLSPSVS